MAIVSCYICLFLFVIFAVVVSGLSKPHPPKMNWYYPPPDIFHTVPFNLKMFILLRINLTLMAHLGKKKWQIYIKSLLMGIYRHWWGRMSCNMWLLVLMDMHEWEKGKRKAVWILSENQKKNNKKKHYEFLPEFFWDEELLFAILLMSSSLLLLSQCFSHCAPPPLCQPSSDVCWFRWASKNFKLKILFNL